VFDPNDGESLHHSAQFGHLECLEMLLAHGANLSERHPNWNNTPLFFLAGHNNEKSGDAPCAPAR
jgi:ankyrin repeat protein